MADRADFEEWALKLSRYRLARRRPPNQDQYDDLATGDSWDAWRAAVAAERERWLDTVRHAVSELEELDEETAQAQAAALRLLCEAKVASDDE